MPQGGVLAARGAERMSIDKTDGKGSREQGGGVSEPRKELDKALLCLHLEAPASVVNDVTEKVNAALAARDSVFRSQVKKLRESVRRRDAELAELREEVGRLRSGIAEYLAQRRSCETQIAGLRTRLAAVEAERDRLREALERLVLRCDGDEGVRADGSNIDTLAAHAALAPDAEENGDA